MPRISRILIHGSYGNGDAEAYPAAAPPAPSGVELQGTWYEHTSTTGTTEYDHHWIMGGTRCFSIENGAGENSLIYQCLPPAPVDAGVRMGGFFVVESSPGPTTARARLREVNDAGAWNLAAENDIAGIGTGAWIFVQNERTISSDHRYLRAEIQAEGVGEFRGDSIDVEMFLDLDDELEGDVAEELTAQVAGSEANRSHRMVESHQIQRVVSIPLVFANDATSLNKRNALLDWWTLKEPVRLYLDPDNDPPERFARVIPMGVEATVPGRADRIVLRAAVRDLHWQEYIPIRKQFTVSSDDHREVLDPTLGARTLMNCTVYFATGFANPTEIAVGITGTDRKCHFTTDAATAQSAFVSVSSEGYCVFDDDAPTHVDHNDWLSQDSVPLAFSTTRSEMYVETIAGTRPSQVHLGWWPRWPFEVD